MTYNIQTGTDDLRLAELSIGQYSNLFFTLPNVPRNATRVLLYILTTGGVVSTYVEAEWNDSLGMFSGIVDAYYFSTIGVLKYEVFFTLDEYKHMFGGSGYIRVKKTTLDTPPQPPPVGPLPFGYTECEYLESTGTQWIDTGYSFEPTDVVGAGFEGSLLDDRFRIATYPWNRSGASKFAFGWKEGSTCFAWGGNSTGFTRINCFDASVEWEYKNYTFTVNNISRNVNSTSRPSLKTPTGNIHINKDHAGVIGGTCRFYKFYHKKNDILVRDFLPALDLDGRPCMFDTVTQQPFYNQGTGEFLYKIKGT